jgi:hypothetical protein
LENKEGFAWKVLHQYIHNHAYPRPKDWNRWLQLNNLLPGASV